ncbi:MAG: penicillin-binding protein 2 [Candidatus Magasanikbacteria bacterium]
MDNESPKLFPVAEDVGKGFQLTNNQKYGWVEDSFGFEKNSGHQVSLPGSNRYVASSISLSFLRYLFTFVGIVLFFLFIRIFYLQVVRGQYYLSVAENNRQREISIPSERGIIFDRNMNELTKNIPNFSLALIPQDLPRRKEERKKVVEKLAELTDKGAGEIGYILEKYGSYSYESIIIQEGLSYDEALLVHIAAADLPGISIYRGSKRLYLFHQTINTSTEDLIVKAPSSLSHIVGYLGKLNPEELDSLYSQGYLPSDSLGKVGLEKTYENVLRGEYGKRTIEVNALGREQVVIAEESPMPGSHLKLSVDTTIQNKLEDIIRESFEKSEKSRAVAIAIDPRNGEILALVSLPSFNNNDFSGGISSEKYSSYIEDEDRPLFNRAIGGTYPSGSTIKPFIAAAALQEGVINRNTSILSTGGIQVGPWFFPDWKYGGHGFTDVRKSLAWSVNTFYYYIGGGHNEFVGLGVDVISEYLTKFGFSKKLGIDLPSEAEGFIPTKEWKSQELDEQWYIGDTYNLSIGQGYFLVTPLQIASLTAMIANGGTHYKPHLVYSTIDPISDQETRVNPEIITGHGINPSHIGTVRLGMRDCVLYGSCRLLSSLPINVAGKTGTAQWHSEKDNHAWFTSFAPYDSPEIVLTVLVEEGGEGSEVAVPIANQFYYWWSQYRSGLVDG